MGGNVTGWIHGGWGNQRILASWRELDGLHGGDRQECSGLLSFGRLFGKIEIGKLAYGNVG